MLFLFNPRQSQHCAIPSASFGGRYTMARIGNKLKLEKRYDGLEKSMNSENFPGSTWIF